MPDFELDWQAHKVRAVIEGGEWRGLQLAGEHLLSESQQLVPHEEGDLERSGTVTGDRSQQTVAVAYDRPYAVVQHEDLTFRHDEGRQAKYLEQPMRTERETMLAIIAHAARF